MDLQPNPNAALYFGQVMHKRLRPFAHRFAYKVFSLYLDIDVLGETCRELRFLSHNRFNLLSFHDSDHGPRDGGALRAWAEQELTRHGLAEAAHNIRLLCFPRVLGYVFNPLSIWYCFAANGKLRAVIYEVRNTFGEKHSYVLPVSAERDESDPVKQSCGKQLYVSPFIAMRSHYRFRLRQPGAHLSILIRQWVDGEELLVATQTGRRRPLSDAALLHAFFSIPLMSMKVITAIHWQALKLWLKGAKIEHPPALAQEAIATSAIRPSDPFAAEIIESQ